MSSDARSHSESGTPELPASPEPAATPVPTPQSIAGALASFVGRFGVVLVLIIFIIVFSILTPSTFPTAGNARTIVGDNSITLLLALAGMLPLIVGEFDLSIGNQLGLSTVIVASLTAHHHVSLLWASLIAVAIGAAIGLVNGVLITKMHVSSFIATLGVGTIISGVMLAITGGAIIFEGIPQGLRTFAQTQIVGIPKVAVVAVLAVTLLWYATEHTPIGRHLYATGLGREAARLAGVRTTPLVIGSFVFSGVGSAFAGVLELGRVGAAHPDLGPAFLLPALAAAFLGATTIRPGRFNVWGTAVAVLLVAVGTTGLELDGAPFWVEPVFNGSVLVIAVALSGIAAHRSRRA